MSKIGRKPIELGGTKVSLVANEVHYKGKKASGIHILPVGLVVEVGEKEILLKPTKVNNDTNRIWGLHRALLANKIKGADVGFEKQLRIVGLGFKGMLSGNKLQMSLGFSHKIDYILPDAVTVVIDRTGQILTFHSFDKELLGQVCSDIRALRPPEPYKGTGITYATEVILRKAGKTKSS